MAVSVFTITIEALDATELASFWLALLHYEIEPNYTSSIQIGDPAGHGPSFLFAPSTNTKTVKNRIHFDLRPDDQATAVDRAIELGASRISVGQPSDASWVVMADPEGNEFCILQSQTDFNSYRASMTV